MALLLGAIETVYSRFLVFNKGQFPPPVFLPEIVNISGICEQVKGLFWSYVLSFAPETVLYS